MIAAMIVIFLVILFVLSLTQLGSYPEYAIMISFISGVVLAYIIYCATNENAVGFSLIRDLFNGKIFFDYIRKKRETERGYRSNIIGNYKGKSDILSEAYQEEMSTLSGGYDRLGPRPEPRPGPGPRPDSYIAASVREQAWGRGAKNKSQLVAIGHKAVQDHYTQVEIKKEKPKPDPVQELPAYNYGDYKRPPNDIFK